MLLQSPNLVDLGGSQAVVGHCLSSCILGSILGEDVMFFQSKWSKSNTKDRLKQVESRKRVSLWHAGHRAWHGEEEAHTAVSQGTSLFSLQFSSSFP